MAASEFRQRSSGLCSCLFVLALVLLAQLTAGVRARRSELQEGGQAVYCVAKPEADAGQLQEALDWTCGTGSTLGSVDCSAIQQGGQCFDPDTVAGHASYAFTLYYYQQSAASHACDFKGLATLTYTNPSTGSCVFPTTALASPSNSSTLSPSVGNTFPQSSYISPAPSPNGVAPHSSIFSSGTSFLVCMLPLVIMLL